MISIHTLMDIAIVKTHWDPFKALVNLAQHGVGFEDATVSSGRLKEKLRQSIKPRRSEETQCK